MPPKKSAAKGKKGKKRARTPEPADPTSNVDAAETQKGPAKRAKKSAPKENPDPAEAPVDKSDLVDEAPSVVSKPATSDSNQPATSDADKPADPKVKLTGKFDLYGMGLPFLHKVYLPPGTTTPNPEELYKIILTYQAKKDNTAKITLPDDFTTRSSGTFKSFVLCDPMEEMPFPIKITDIKEIEVKFSAGQVDTAEYLSEAVNGSGVSGRLELDENNCGVQSASGGIKMRQLWSKADEEGKTKELFEGFFSFNVSYSGMYRRKGHGSGQNVEMGFWAVRGVV